VEGRARYLWRLAYAENVIPDHLADRVFVLGVWTQPEKLKAVLGSYEMIGMALARSCREEIDTTCGH